MSNARDPIALVEACYDLNATESAWLQTIAQHAGPLMRVDTVLAYHIDLGDGPSHPRPVSAEHDEDVVGRIRYMADLLDRRRAGNVSFFESLQAKVYNR